MCKYHRQFSIIGAGAIGHLWACSFQRQKFPYRLYTRHQQTPTSIEFLSPQIKWQSTITYTPLCQWQTADVLLICVKAQQLTSLCEQLHHHLNQPNQASQSSNDSTLPGFTKESRAFKRPTYPAIILMMNGLGLTDIVQHYLPGAPVVHAAVTHGVKRLKNQLIYTGSGQTLLGEMSHQNLKAKFAPIIAPLNQALPEVIWNEKHETTLYLKLITNAIINPVTALLQCKNGQILNNNQLIPTANALLEELFPLLEKLIPQFDPAEIRQNIIRVAKATAENSSSMKEDVLKKRTTEIDFINGHLLKLAKKHAINLPKNHQIIQQIKRLAH
ncbi:ketopantoate reductase family protein [Aliikangiella maris]|uniref:2-dehydropantoate 2-reductase n=2 Tax=Aliikangiella maris TaxID=3162458 RepID=A0ABV2BT87_9GAMM